MFRKNSRILPGGSSTRSGRESLARQSEKPFSDINNSNHFSNDNATSVFSTTAPARLVRDLAFLNEPGDPKAEPMLKEPSPRGNCTLRGIRSRLALKVEGLARVSKNAGGRPRLASVAFDGRYMSLAL